MHSGVFLEQPVITKRFLFHVLGFQQFPFDICHSKTSSDTNGSHDLGLTIYLGSNKARMFLVFIDSGQ
jgi:hypothetical protein